MSKRKTIRIDGIQAHTLGVTPCDCGKSCGFMSINLHDQQGNVIATAGLDRTEAVEIASVLMELVELADQASRRAQGRTLQ
jgi:hypothetical protein